MSAKPTPAAPQLRRMREVDIDALMEIELRSYPFPWTPGNFRDCLRAGYAMWVLEDDVGLVGYAAASVQAGEAHLLNICIDPKLQSRGQGRRLLRAMRTIARGQGAERMFLEVRPSNTHAIALYHDEGFNEIGRRPRYYPDHDGRREDAIVMAMELFD
ncbi:ribosomal protein S18-alanine N-acetyltransferase [Solilutibacter tolerans]|uniref:[Ribosomal protein bS18]-alanine N-acetyltransferase n=1 Tax=Solilutibacter tolerans TaxID=1604334 RepID=A0A1N6N9S3_9GAMM|nr:ribosomal protein S18-alanine N-acetyltransferase [Lysobacter tolerans]SIP88808.1 [SSU ribosomal protein S18P]-alanine acetyltransferase [Lysobacter tolerans]